MLPLAVPGKVYLTPPDPAAALHTLAGLFIRSIQQAPKSDSLEERLKAINNHFTYSLYLNICRSLFEKDKLLFAFLLTVRIMLSQGQLAPAAYAFLLTGGVGVQEKQVAKPANTNWLSEKSWGEICRAPNVTSSFLDLPDTVAAAPAEWQPLAESVEPQSMPLPMGYDERLTAFERVMLLRMLRPDKLVPGIQLFVQGTLGTKFTEPPPFDLAGGLSG